MHIYIFALLLISDPDCYQLVSMNRIYPTTNKMPVTKKQDVSKSTSTKNVLIISISTFVSIIIFIAMAMAIKMVVKERRAIPKHNENVELTSTDAYLGKSNNKCHVFRRYHTQ